MQDVAWHPRHEYMFGSVGDDKKLILWDMCKPHDKGGGPKARPQELAAGMRALGCAQSLFH